MTQEEKQGVVLTKGKKGLWFYLKVLATFTFLIVLAMAIAIGYVYNRLTTDNRLDSIIMAKASSALNMSVSYKKLSFSFPEISLEQVGLATDSDALKAEFTLNRLSVVPDIWAAFAGELMISSINLSDATGSVIIKKGSAGLTKKEAAAGDSSSNWKEIKLPFKSILLSNVSFSYEDQTTNQKQNLFLTQAGISQAMLSSTFPIKADLKIPEIGRIKLVGDLDWPESLSFNISGDIQKFDRLIGFIPEEHRARLKQFNSATVSIDGKYLFSGALELDDAVVSVVPGIKVNLKASLPSISPLSGQLTMNAEKVSIETLLGLAKGLIPDSLGLKVTGDPIGGALAIKFEESKLKEINAKVNPGKLNLNLALLPAPVDINGGQLEYNGEYLSVSNLGASLKGNKIDLSKGKIFTSPLKMQADIRLEVYLESVFTLAKPFLPAIPIAIKPSGKASFAGNFNYDGVTPKISGALRSDKFVLEETKQKVDLSFTNFLAKMENLSPDAGILNIESAQVKGIGSEFSISGSLKNNKEMELDYKAKGFVDLNSLAAVAAPIFNLPVNSGQFKGKVDFDAGLKGAKSNLQPSGTVKLSNVFASLPERGVLVENINGEASADINQLVIQKLEGRMLGGDVSGSGSLKNYKAPFLNFKAQTGNTDLAMVLTFMKKNFPEMPAELIFSGKTDLNFTLTGKSSEPEFTGNAVIKNGEFFHPAVLRKITNINGPVIVNNKGLRTEKLSATWGKSQGRVSGAIKDWGKFLMDFGYEVNPLEITDASGFFLDGTGYKVTAIGTGKGKLVGTLDKLLLTGAAYATAGMFEAPVSEKGDTYKFPFRELTAPFSFTNGLFRVQEAQLNVFGGDLKASMNVFVEKSPIEFDFDVIASGVQTQLFLKQNTSMGDALNGGVDGKFKAKGNVLGLVSLNGLANIGMKEGAYKAPPVVQSICNKLNAPHLASGQIRNMAADCVVQGGRFNTNNLVSKTKDGFMTFSGSIGLDTTIDGTSEMNLTREACQGSNVLKQLIGKEEYLVIPVSIKGSMMSPKVNIPLEKMLKDAATKNVKSTLENKAKEALGKLFGKKKNDSNNSQTPVNQPTGTNPPEVQEPKKEKPPLKEVGDKLKDLGKDLKKIFKF